MTSRAALNAPIKAVVCFDFYDGGETGILFWSQGGSSVFEVIGESSDGFRRAYLLEAIQVSYMDEVRQLPDYAALVARSSFMVPGPSSQIEALKAKVANTQRSGEKYLSISSPYLENMTFRPISGQQLDLILAADTPQVRFDMAQKFVD